MKRRWMAAALMLLLTGMTACGQEEAGNPVDYVALGDSLAAGQTAESEMSEGYSGLIAAELEQRGQLGSYTNELAYPGLTTEEVLLSLETAEAEKLLEKADLVTVSAGANDLLRLVQLDPATGMLQFDEAVTDAALLQAGLTLREILERVSEQAPDADRYVMGYYFAFPHVPAEEREAIARQIDRLNETLASAAEEEGAVFVPVAEMFGDDATDLLPNPSDIHPNSEGYETMAQAFFEKYEEI